MTYVGGDRILPSYIKLEGDGVIHIEPLEVLIPHVGIGGGRTYYVGPLETWIVIVELEIGSIPLMKGSRVAR